MNENAHHEPQIVSSQPTSKANPLIGWLLPIGFVVVAVVLLMGSRRVSIPIPEAVEIDGSRLIVEPRRVAMTDPPHVMIEGLPQTCNGCHQIFSSQSPAGATLQYHQDVHLFHGMNNRCVNCHDAEHREHLTLRDGTRITFAQTPLLCAQCHGTAYRDWQAGTHGKTLGSWVTGSESQQRLSCNECHDPHSPRFDPMEPLPGPRTLRMGEPRTDHAHHDEGKESPLQRWLRDLDAAEHGANPGGRR